MPATSPRYSRISDNRKKTTKMIAHELKISQRIWDTHDNRFGTVLLIAGQDRDASLTPEDTDIVILYRPEDSDGECETLAEDAYPVVRDRLLQGEAVCLEINRDEFDEYRNYDYYCPAFDENCWEFETDMK